MKKQLLLSSVVTLTIGSLIYILFRTESLKVFVWLDSLSCLPIAENMREFTLEMVDGVPNWMLYSLPDGLWLSSYICSMLLIWKNRITKESQGWIFCMPIIAVLSEAGQLFKIIPGTFDWMDVMMYFLGTLFPLAIYKKTKTNK